MNVQEILDLIEEVLDNGSSIPFSSKIAVDVEAIRSHVNEIRLELPVEIEKAQEIVDHYNSIVKKASTEASVTTSTAHKQADEIVGAAKEKAKGIVGNAEANSKATLAAATEQARKMVGTTEIARLAQEYSDKVRSQAAKDAQTIIKNAEEEASAIVKDANIKAETVKKNAAEWSANLRQVTTRFVSDIMKNSDDVLSQSITEIRKARQSIQAAVDKK
ncbi:MAG: DivIVA domain-containing protein [Clostridia bacterium]|nr:DivIVA domain-containing protein [Clostridia bacterium]